MEGWHVPTIKSLLLFYGVSRTRLAHVILVNFILAETHNLDFFFCCNIAVPEVWQNFWYRMYLF